MIGNVLKQAWWVLLLRGIVAIVFALLLLFAPGITLATGAISFAVLFGLYALIDGISAIVSAIMRREGQWLLILIIGVVGVVAGLAALGNPLLFSVLTITIMIYIVAFNAIAGGIVEIIGAWQLRKEIDNEWMMILGGVLSVLFGVILFARPATGIEILITLVAFFLLMKGIMQGALAFRVRGWAGKIENAKSALPQS